jgi:DNA-binding GntR family transcriptional regulator
MKRYVGVKSGHDSVRTKSENAEIRQLMSLQNVLRVPLNANSLVDQATQAIDHAIYVGQLLPGQRISEAELAGQFGISRGPLREAISRLEGRRLIERVPHQGVRVIQLDDNAINEVFLLREALEGMACRIAAEKHTKEQFQEWQQLLRAHELASNAADGTFDDLRNKDWDFHLSIIRATGNHRLETMLIKDVYYQLRLYCYQHRNIASQRKTGVKGHKDILAALKTRDGEAAEGAMRSHISTARKNLVFGTGT